MDFYLGREGADYTQTLLALSKRGLIKCFTSSNMMCTIAYLFEKTKALPKKEIPKEIFELSKLIDILDVSKEHILKATSMGGRDFEDNVQIACAEGRCDNIITDNIKDYINSAVPALSPEEFLRSYFSS